MASSESISDSSPSAPRKTRITYKSWKIIVKGWIFGQIVANIYVILELLIGSLLTHCDASFLKASYNIIGFPTEDEHISLLDFLTNGSISAANQESQISFVMALYQEALWHWFWVRSPFSHGNASGENKGNNIERKVCASSGSEENRILCPKRL